MESHQEKITARFLYMLVEMWGLIITTSVQMPLGYGKETRNLLFLKETAVLLVFTCTCRQRPLGSRAFLLSSAVPLPNTGTVTVSHLWDSLHLCIYVKASLQLGFWRCCTELEQYALPSPSPSEQCKINSVIIHKAGTVTLNFQSWVPGVEQTPRDVMAPQEGPAQGLPAEGDRSTCSNHFTPPFSRV